MPWKFGWDHDGSYDNHKGRGQQQWLGGGSVKEPNIGTEYMSELLDGDTEKHMDGGNRGKEGHLWTLESTTAGWRNDG